ncbi:MAG: hypothetical protein K6D37_07220 [Prevotella sp.]|jgi:hypothetical protein|nr:hypothetical protein [Prevotella sp.]
MKTTNKRDVTLDGMLTVGKLENGLRWADFECCEEAEVEAFFGRFRVQGMHDGNLYMEQLPKRVRRKPMFRQDNSSLSLGRNGYYYFVFTLPEDQLAELPGKLVSEANEAAAKVIRSIWSEE